MHILLNTLYVKYVSLKRGYLYLIYKTYPLDFLQVAQHKINQRNQGIRALPFKDNSQIPLTFL